MSTKSWVGIKY